MWKKKTKIAVLIIGILIFAALAYAQKEMSVEIIFSHDSGFYPDEFMLTIEGNDRYILRYTLDGSTPNATSLIYTEPIKIEDASTHENVYSSRTDVSPGFDDDSRGFVVPADPVDKCSIVRVAQFDAEGTCVSEESRVYFVGFDEKSVYDDIWVVSIVTDPANLFDPDTGIYVMGNIYENAEPADRWWVTDANYRERGIEWEREAIVDIFAGQDKNHMESSEAGLRIRGNSSRALVKKSFSLYARSIYSGSDTFSIDYFENGREPHKMALISGGYNDQGSLKNWMAWKLAVESDSDCATMQMIPCALFLDGEYWGLYFLAEAYGKDYINIHYNVNEDDVIMYKNNKLEEGIDEDEVLYQYMQTYISENDMRVGEYYEEACNIIDMESFIDYYALEIYVGNMDWLPNNSAFWRTRDVDLQNAYYDGKWRYMFFDADNGNILQNAEVDTITRAIEHDTVFASLIRNEKVQEMLRERLWELQSIYEEHCDEWLDEWFNQLGDAVAQSRERYLGENAVFEDFPQSTIDVMRDYPQNRMEYLEQYMSESFK